MITSFRGDNKFLSNFFIESDGTCVEVEYQAIKGAGIRDMLHVLQSYHEKDQIASKSIPSLSKARGRRVPLFVPRAQWNDLIAFQMMSFFVTKKFFDHPSLAERLVATVDEELIEGNNWNDTTWGCIWEDGEWVGENQLGHILMVVREALGGE